MDCYFGGKDIHISANAAGKSVSTMIDGLKTYKFDNKK